WTIHRSVSVVGVLADRGELGEAHRVAAQLIESAQRRRHRMDEGRSRWIMAEVLRRQGKGLSGGQGVNPHPSGFKDKCALAKKRNPRPCLVCHQSNDATFGSCR